MQDNIITLLTDAQWYFVGGYTVNKSSAEVRGLSSTGHLLYKYWTGIYDLHIIIIIIIIKS